MLASRAFAQRRTPLLLRSLSTIEASASKGASIPPPPIQSKTKLPSTSSPALVASSSTTNEEVQAQPEGKPTGRKRKSAVRHRPQISLQKPRKWNRPIAPGVLPAYDEALKYIEADSAKLRRELADAQKNLSRLEREGANGEELDGLREKVGILEVQSEVNRPSVRWEAANGMGDLTKPVFRHLAEQKWRREGTLDLLMERIYQMKVVPDLLPEMHPTFDLRLSFPEPPPTSTYLRTRTSRRYQPVEPGIYLLPEQTRRPPKLYTSVFHPENRLYTLVMLDADVPDPENASFTTFLHWIVPNISLSAASSGELASLSHTKYIPPHPQRGSPYHRYSLFLLPHKDPSAKISLPPTTDEGREGFDLRKFCEENGIEAGRGGACHMWREVWDETVSDIYKHTLKSPEPRYGLPPRADRYADVKALKKRIS